MSDSKSEKWNITLDLIKQEIKDSHYLRNAPSCEVKESIEAFIRHADAYPSIYKLQPGNRRIIKKWLDSL